MKFIKDYRKPIIKFLIIIFFILIILYIIRLYYKNFHIFGKKYYQINSVKASIEIKA